MNSSSKRYNVNSVSLKEFSNVVEQHENKDAEQCEECESKNEAYASISNKCKGLEQCSLELDRKAHRTISIGAHHRLNAQLS